MSSSNDVRSIRSWLNAAYPEAIIHVQRNLVDSGKPYFFIEHVEERFVDRGRSYHDVLRTFRIHLMTKGASSQAPAPEVYWKTREVLDYLLDRCLEERVIPSYQYNLVYPTPVATTRSGGSMPAGTYYFAVTSVNSQDDESLLSLSSSVTVASPNQDIYVLIPNWPLGSPIGSNYRVYYRPTTSAPWAAVKEVEVTPNTTAAFTTQARITSVTPIDAAQPPSTSRMHHGFLKIQEANLVLNESLMVDDEFRGFVQFKALSHSYHRRIPAPTMSEVTISTTIH